MRSRPFDARVGAQVPCYEFTIQTRAHLGLDLLTAAAVDGTTALLFRAAGLLTLAFAIGSARILRAGVPTLLLVFSLTLGFALHGLVLDSLAPLGTRMEFAIALIGLFLAMHFTGRIDPELDTAIAEDEEALQAKLAQPNWMERLGLICGGAAIVIALESVARPMRQIGLGLSSDDTAFGVAFLIIVLLGAAAFRNFFPTKRHGKLTASLMMGAAALTCVIAIGRLEGFSAVTSLASFLRNIGSLLIFVDGPPTIFRMDISHLGTWRADLLIAGASLMLPGLLIGVALSGARQSRSFSSLLIGAAIGTAACIVILRSGAASLDIEQLGSTSHMEGFLGIAAYTAGIGVLCVALASGSSSARFVGVAGALALGAAPSFLAPSDAWLFSPWDEAPSVNPMLVIESVEGLLTVEPVRQHPVATLDRDRITPAPWEEDGDGDRIRQSLALLPNSDADLRVLFVGQLTPARVDVFQNSRALTLDVTAAWHRHMPALNEELFRGSSRSPNSEILSLSVARERLNRGDYDLVIVPPNIGRRLPSLPAQYDSAPVATPRSHGWSVPEGTIAVVWLDTASDLGNTDLGESVLICTLPFNEPSIGLVLGELPASNLTVPGGGRDSAPTAVSTLRLRAYQRQHLSRSRLFDRLGRAAVGTPHESWMAALALHYGVQVEISPFGGWAQGIEITAEMLEHLRDAALKESELRPDLRRFWEQVSKTLRTVRSPDLILEYVEPIALAHSPWFELDYAVVVAYMEFDMPEEVSTRLPGLVEEDRYDIELMLLCANWEADSGRDEKALDYLRSAHQIQPGRWDVIRFAASVAHRSRSSDAAVWIQRAIELDPEDHELREMLDEIQNPPE